MLSSRAWATPLDWEMSRLTPVVRMLSTTCGMTTTITSARIMDATMTSMRVNPSSPRAGRPCRAERAGAVSGQ